MIQPPAIKYIREVDLSEYFYMYIQQLEFTIQPTCRKSHTVLQRVNGWRVFTQTLA